MKLQSTRRKTEITDISQFPLLSFYGNKRSDKVAFNTRYTYRAQLRNNGKHRILFIIRWMIYTANYFTFEWNSIWSVLLFFSLVFGLFNFSEFHPHSVPEIQTFWRNSTSEATPREKKKGIERLCHVVCTSAALLLVNSAKTRKRWRRNKKKAKKKEPDGKGWQKELFCRDAIVQSNKRPASCRRRNSALCPEISRTSVEEKASLRKNITSDRHVNPRLHSNLPAIHMIYDPNVLLSKN